MKTTEFFICTDIEQGMLVRLERIKRGWRQVDLAQFTGITQAEVSAFERGLNVIPVVKTRIYQALDLNVEEG